MNKSTGIIFITSAVVGIVYEHILKAGYITSIYFVFILFVTMMAGIKHYKHGPYCGVSYFREYGAYGLFQWIEPKSVSTYKTFQHGFGGLTVKTMIAAHVYVLIISLIDFLHPELAHSYFEVTSKITNSMMKITFGQDKLTWKLIYLDKAERLPFIQHTQGAVLLMTFGVVVYALTQFCSRIKRDSRAFALRFFSTTETLSGHPVYRRTSEDKKRPCINLKRAIMVIVLFWFVALLFSVLPVTAPNPHMSWEDCYIKRGCYILEPQNSRIGMLFYALFAPLVYLFLIPTAIAVTSTITSAFLRDVRRRYTTKKDSP